LEHYKPRGSSASQRRLDVFRDEGDFIGADYYKALDQHLKNSHKLIVVCSPDSVQRCGHSNGAAR